MHFIHSQCCHIYAEDKEQDFKFNFELFAYVSHSNLRCFMICINQPHMIL